MKKIILFFALLCTLQLAHCQADTFWLVRYGDQVRDGIELRPIQNGYNLQLHGDVDTSYPEIEQVLLESDVPFYGTESGIWIFRQENQDIEGLFDQLLSAMDGLIDKIIQSRIRKIRKT